MRHLIRSSLFLAMVLGAIAGTGCVSKKGNVFTEPAQPRTLIPAASFEIVLVDLRKDVTKGLMHIPIMSFPWQENEVRPEVGDEFRPLFAEVVSAYRSPGDRPLVFQIEIIEGLARFEAHAFSEDEYVKSSLRLTVSDGTSGELLGTALGYGEGFRRSIDASPKRVQRMFIASVEAALREALDKFAAGGAPRI